MAIRVREADVERDRDVIVTLLEEHLPDHAGPAHYEWRYLANPHGRARVWLAQDEDRSAVIGAAAAFPRRMRVQGRETTCWNLGDFCVRKDFRTLGPALMLQRACVGAVLEGAVPFAYDHPSCSMMAIYRRMGVDKTGEIVRYARVLRIDDKVRKVLGDGWISRGVSGVGNVVVSIAGLGLAVRRRFDASSLRERFDDRLAGLANRVEHGAEIVGVRSADYLNWRYLDHPTFRFQVLTIERDDRPMGFVVFRRRGENAVLSDLVAIDDRDVADALIASAVRTLQEEGTQTLSAPVLESSGVVPILKRWGFVARESGPFVVSTRPGGELDGVVNDRDRWFHTDGDRDV